MERISGLKYFRIKRGMEIMNRITPFGLWMCSPEGIPALFSLLERGEDTFNWFIEMNIKREPFLCGKDNSYI